MLEEQIKLLYGKDAKKGYDAMRFLEQESDKSDTVYSYMDTFAYMLGNDNSYIRTRALILIAANAKWDTENKIDEIIDEYLTHIIDVKPITSRMCIKVLPIIVKYKPDLKSDIIEALQKANTMIYADSMQPLVQKDINKALQDIELI